MKSLELSLDTPEKLRIVARALGSDVRIQIMQLLDECSMNVLELAQKMNVPVSTVSNNVVILEEADLIRSERQNGVRGVMKLCSRKKDQVLIRLDKQRKEELYSHFQRMPLGHYSDCQITPVCGMLDSNGIIGSMDDVCTFYAPEHFDAQMLWFRQGYVEYRFSNQLLQGNDIKSLEVSFEACSEAPNYRRDWPSDITVWINHVELGTWRCPGDFGGRKGCNNPAWWPLSSTQYGLLKRWQVDDEGCSLDDVPISEVTLSQLHLEKLPYINLRIGIRKDAAAQGGINLFGEHFGDYNQPIIMRLDVMKHHSAEGSKV